MSWRYSLAGLTMASGTGKRRVFEGEQDLLDFARSYLSEAFPNPERQGCPPDDALRSLARRPTQSHESISDHLTCCSPCFKAYMAHLAEASGRIRRITWIKRSAAALGAAAILALFAYLFITKRWTAPTVAPRTPAPITAPGKPELAQATATYVPVVIDLSNVSPTRGSNQGTTRNVPQRIPSASPLDLTLRLPLGSEERPYLITLRSGRHTVWLESARARRENGDTLLRVHADFRAIPPGSYNLKVSSIGRHLTVAVSIESALRESTEPKR